MPRAPQHSERCGAYLPLYFPEIDRFRNNSRSEWFFAFLDRFPTPGSITALDKEAFIEVAWDLIGRKVAKVRLLADIYDAMKRKGWVRASAGKLKVTGPGWEALSALDLYADGIPGTKRPECLACLDWSVRRHHLAGKIGAAVLERFLALKWAKRVRGTRVIRFSPRGERAFMEWLELEAEPGSWA